MTHKEKEPETPAELQKLERKLSATKNPDDRKERQREVDIRAFKSLAGPNIDPI